MRVFRIRRALRRPGGCAVERRGRLQSWFGALRRRKVTLGGLALLGLAGSPLLTLDLVAAGGDLRLVDAARQQDAGRVGVLLAEGIDVNAAQPDGATALHWAAHWDDLQTAERLIVGGADVNATNDYGITPLWLASVNGSRAMLETLLAAGANPNAGNPNGETPLMTAVRTGAVHAVQALLEGGANVDAREASRGQTALMWALAEGHVGVARLLIEHGADVRARTYSRLGSAPVFRRGDPAREGGFNPLLFAARRGDVPAARLLLQHGADVDETAIDGTSPVLVAAMRGHVEFAKFLLQEGADPDAFGLGFTALHWAAGRWESTFTQDYPVESGEWSVLGGVPSASDRVELVTALLEHDADPNARLARRPPRFGGASGGASRVDIVGATPFHLAAGAGDLDVMRVLLRYGANPTLRTESEATPLMAAAGSMLIMPSGQSVGFRRPESRHLDAATLCLELGLDIDARDAAGNTALHVAAGKSFDAMIELLVDHGASVSARNALGDTALGTAFRQRGIVRVVSRSTVDLLERLGVPE